MPFIIVTLLVFHFEISGMLCTNMHPQNIPAILITLLVLGFEISGIFFNDEQSLKIQDISTTL